MPSWLDPRRPWTVRVGDCRAAMADMDPDSVDATVADTPYGLSTVLDPPRLHQEAAWAKIMAGREERSRPLQEYFAEALADRERRYGDCPMPTAEAVAMLTAAMEVRRNLGSPFDRLLGEWLDTGENPRLKGRGFMGNEWDSLVPPPNAWRAVHRVQKPGSYLFAFAGARTHGLIDTAIRIADFEVDDEFCVWAYGCLSEDTEIWVDGAWRHYSAAMAGSTVMAYSPDDGTISMQKVEELLVYDYDDAAFAIRSPDTDHIVSRNHRCIVWRDCKWRFVVAEHLSQTETIPTIAGHMCGLLEGLREVRESREANGLVDVLAEMQRSCPWEGVGEARGQGQIGLDQEEHGVVSAEDVRPKQSGVARRSDATQLEGELQGREVRSLPRSLQAYGASGRIHHRASPRGGDGDRKALDQDGSGTPHQPRLPGQQAGELDAVCLQQRPQGVRMEGVASASVAGVTRIHYRGKVWCIRVKGGAFLARRNGKVFITGNSGMPKRVRLDLKIDQHFGKAGERPVIGKGINYEAKKRHGGTWKGSVFGNEREEPGPLITAAATPEAARFVGWDRARRPAFEPVVVAMKPLRGTIAENALRYGTGGLHVDACRIERGDAGEVRLSTRTGHSANRRYGEGLGDGNGENIVMHARGGYPANLILSEEAAAELDASAPSSRDGVAVKRNTTGKVTGRIFKVKSTGEDATFGGGGGPSRFFYVAKAATSERDKGLEAMPVMTPGERSGREDGSAGINGYAGTRGEARNSGPCVKPIALMRYLVRMACPPGAWDQDVEKRPLVMDCFGGTMSTGVACMVEGVRFVGMEQSEEYAAIGRARLQHAYALPSEVEGVDEVDVSAPPVATAGAQRTLF